MKWKDKLKVALAETPTVEFSEDCLEMELRKPAKTQINGVFTVNRSNQKRHFSKNNVELEETKADYFHAILARFYEKGIKFEVAADDFVFVDEAQKLKISDMEFLKINKSDVLCHIQQSALMKHLFSHSPFLLDDFAFEIKERESLLSKTAKTRFEKYAEAVKDVTKKWFADLLNRN